MDEYRVYLADPVSGDARGEVIVWADTELDARWKAEDEHPGSEAVAAEWTGASFRP